MQKKSRNITKRISDYEGSTYMNIKRAIKTAALSMTDIMMFTVPAMAAWENYWFDVDVAEDSISEDYTRNLTKDNDDTYGYIKISNSNVSEMDKFEMSINGPEYYNYNYTGNINVGTFIGRMYPEYSQPEKPSKGQSYRLRAQTYAYYVHVDGTWEP